MPGKGDFYLEIYLHLSFKQKKPILLLDNGLSGVAIELKPCNWKAKAVTLYQEAQIKYENDKTIK